MTGLVGRHLLGIWTREQNYLNPPKKTPYLVWRNVYEVSSGRRYESPGTLCAPLDECSEEERNAAYGLPAWTPPEEELRWDVGFHAWLKGKRDQ